MKTAMKAPKTWSLVFRTALLVGLVSLASFVAPGFVSAQVLRVQTTEGPVQGALTTTPGVWRFLGIPYAAAPLRFARPEPAAVHAGVLFANSFPPACPQRPGGACASQSEDCLALNVWAPIASRLPPAERPVMVWIHGGGFTSGCTAEPGYDAEALASRGVVVVTVQYRLGPLGFMALEELVAEDPESSSGNWALWDLIAALEWVQQNIAVFGGNPNNVTTFGESAGGNLQCALLASPQAAGLFHRSIVESGSCSFGAYPLYTTPGTAVDGNTAVDQGAIAAAILGCPASGRRRLNCLRKVPADRLVAQNVVTNARFRPTIDNVVLEEKPLLVIAARGTGGREVLVGSNGEEGFASFRTIDTSDYGNALAQQWGADVAAVLLGIYPPPPDPADNGAQLELVFSELMQNCPAASTAGAARDGGEDAYLYHFIHQREGCATGPCPAFHGAELAYVFDNLEIYPWPGRRIPRADALLARKMGTAWTGFARDGVPTTTPAWPLWDRASTAFFVFDTGLADPVSTDYRGGRCRELGAAFLAVDGDRDQIWDDADNCPATINSNQIDLEGDGVGDACDRCPFADDPDQLDQGGVASPADGTGASPDGIGDGCQCGDVDGDGRVTSRDGLRIFFQRGRFTPEQVARCNVTGAPGGGFENCTVEDARAIWDQVSGAAPAAVSQICQAAIGPIL